MRYHPISKDLKARIPALRRQGYNVKKICYLLGLKKSTVYHTLAHFRRHGVPYNHHAHRPSGRRRVLLPEDLKLIVALLKRRHCIYLDELQAEIYNIRGVTLSRSSITRTLHHLQYSHKHVSTRALERNDLMRSAFMNKIADQVPNPDMLIFTDEAARNRRTSARTKGWSLVGRRCVQRRHFIRGQRFSILPILTLDGIVAYDIIPGSVNSERFVEFLRELVVRFFLHLLCLKCV
jgi:transposase